MSANLADGSQADAALPPQAGTPDAPPAGDVETLSLEEAKKLRQENAAMRRRLHETESKLQTREQAELTELERATAERDALRAERAQWLADRQDAALTRVLAEAGALHPELLVARVNRADLDWDARGTLQTDPRRIVGDLRKAYPALFRTPSADGGAGGGPPADANMNAILRRASGRQ